MAGEIRFNPQQNIDAIADFFNPMLDGLITIIPWLLVITLGAGLIRAAMQWRSAGKVLPPIIPGTSLRFVVLSLRPLDLTAQHERDLRCVPLSVGLWGLFFYHLLLVGLPGVVQVMVTDAGTRAALEVVGISLAFFTLFGIFNLQLRHLLDKSIRRHFTVVDFAVISFLMVALGVGIFTWATVRHASFWTGQVAGPFFVDVWLFRTTTNAAIYHLPVIAKLHVLAGSLALGAALHSRVVAHTLLPNLRAWRVHLVDGKPVDAGTVAARLSGVSAEQH
ncbi:MAG: respiratory nitrate reductase subunit gamma [Planctomycetes bacterium]|nr:respiratory nitrate reductase subunit gamma [Planctomycetota bacterium]